MSVRREILEHFRWQELAERMEAESLGMLRFSHVRPCDGAAPFIGCSPLGIEHGCVYVYPDGHDTDEVVGAFADALDRQAEAYRTIAESLRSIAAETRPESP